MAATALCFDGLIVPHVSEEKSKTFIVQAEMAVLKDRGYAIKIVQKPWPQASTWMAEDNECNVNIDSLQSEEANFPA